MQNLIVYFLLFCLPFFIAPISLSEFEIPKVLAAELLIIILTLYTLFFTKPVFKLTPSRFFLAVLFIESLITFLLFRNNQTLFGNPFRLQGVFLFWNLLAFSFVSQTVSLDNLPRNYFLVPLILLLIVTILFGANPAGRAIGTLGEPNFLAATVLFFWPFALLGKKKLKSKVSLLAIISIPVIILFLAKSDSAVLGFVLQITFLFLTTIAKLSSKKSLILCLILLTFSHLAPFFSPELVYESRSEIWHTAWTASLPNFLLGSGFGNIEPVLLESAKTLENTLRFQVVDSSHNIFLDFFLQGGIIAALSLLSLLFLFLRRNIQRNSTKNIILMLGLLAVLSFNPGSIVTLLAFWWLLLQ